jgi:hypothetical protein
VSQSYRFRELLLHFFVKSHLMTHVGKIRLLCADLFRFRNSLGQCEVRNVLVFLERIQHQHFGAFQEIVGCVGNKIGIGDVAEVADPEAENRQFQMHDGQRGDNRAADRKGFMIDSVKLKLWDAWISLWTEGIIELRLNLLVDVGCRVERHVGVLKIVVGPNVVEARKMVAVTVCKENGVEMIDAFAKHLLPEVGTGVDDDAEAIDFDVDRSTESLVAVVHGTAYVALAPDHGHAL